MTSHIDEADLILIDINDLKNLSLNNTVKINDHSPILVFNVFLRLPI